MTETLIPAIAESRAAIAPCARGRSCSSTASSGTPPAARRFVTENPATGQPIAEVAEGGPADVDAAVAAARRAADDGRWSRLSPARPQADPRSAGRT